MKSVRMLLLFLIAVSTMALAATDAKPEVPTSDAQKAFQKMKTLAGSWVGHVSTDLPIRNESIENVPMNVTMRVTSRGNLLMHEMKADNVPADPTKFDDPITLFYLDQDRLMLTHFCDAGNRPRMTAKASPDGKSVEFEFADITGERQHQHMHHAVFTFIDDNHHREDWTFMAGDKMIHASINLERVK